MCFEVRGGGKRHNLCYNLSQHHISVNTDGHTAHRTMSEVIKVNFNDKKELKQSYHENTSHAIHQGSQEEVTKIGKGKGDYYMEENSLPAID